MAAQPRIKPQPSWPIEPVHAPTIAPADASHRDVMSPAMALQARIETVLSSGVGGLSAEPAIDKWPAPIRLIVLFGSAAASWLMAWEIAKYLI